MTVIEALRSALEHLDCVQVEGRENVKRCAVAVDLIEKSIEALSAAERTEEKHENNHDEQREDA